MYISYVAKLFLNVCFVVRAMRAMYIYSFTINGTSTTRAIPHDIFVGVSQANDEGGTIQTLTVRAIPQYNGTVVQCKVFVDDNGLTNNTDIVCYCKLTR